MRYEWGNETDIKVVPYTSSKIQTQSYKFTSHIAAFLSVVLITKMLEICIQLYDQNVQLILKSYLPLVYGTTLKWLFPNANIWVIAQLYYAENKLHPM